MTLKLAPEQPYGVEIFTADGLFIKQMAVSRAFTLVPQHAHVWDHTTMLAVGRVRVWKDGQYDGEYEAPTGLFIAKGVKHAFLTLVDNCVLFCLHNLHGAEAVAILEQHDLLGELERL